MEGATQFELPMDRTLRREPDERRDDDGKGAGPKGAEFVKECLARFKVMKDSEEFAQRPRSQEEVEFNSGKHWDDDLRKERESKDRVIMEVNRTPQYLNQVANAQRMSRPTITIKPNGNGADVDGARVKQGIMRSIDRRSDAEAIRDDCFYRTLEKGWSYYQIAVEWEGNDGRGWKQVLRVRPFYDDFSVYCDPASTEFDRSDAMDWIITQDMPVDAYKAEYGDSYLASLSEMTANTDQQKEWISKDTIRVAVRWYKDRKREKLYMLADDPLAEGKWEDELAGKDDQGRWIGVAHVEGEAVWRWSYRTKIKWCLFNAVEVLDGNEEKTEGREYVRGARYIPIIPVLGRRIVWNKRFIWVGMVRDAIEPCLASDYWLSAITEMVALGPKAPWIVAYEAIAEYREMWDQSNIENYAALFYDAFDAEGEKLPAPFRNFGEPPIQAMTFILKYAEEDLKRVMGIYDRSLGAAGPEHSGIAIQQVQQVKDVANFNYMDNLKRSMTHEARIELDLMPKVYSRPQAIEIVRPDGESEKVEINKIFRDKTTGKDKINDIARGDYDVEIDIGPSIATKREAAANGINEYIKVDPGAAPFVGHIMARNLDFPDAKELEKALKARAAAAGVPMDDQGGESEVPEKFKRQYEQQAKALEQITQLMAELQKKVESDETKMAHERELKAMELASQERRSKMDLEKAVTVKAMDDKSKTDLETMKQMLAAVQTEIASVREERTGWLDRIFKTFGGARDSGNNPDSKSQSM